MLKTTGNRSASRVRCAEQLPAFILLLKIFLSQKVSVNTKPLFEK